MSRIINTVLLYYMEEEMS